MEALATDRRRVAARSVDLAKATGLPKGAIVKLRGIEARRTTEAAYERVLRRLLALIAKSVKDDILTGYAARDTLVTDAVMLDGILEWFAGLRSNRERWTALTLAQVTTLLTNESRRHSARWTATIKSQLNLDLEAIITQEALSGFMEGVSLRTAGLITGIYDDTVRSIAQVTQQAVVSGQSISELRKAIRARLGVSASRAKLIAVDQTGTLVSELNHIRQEQAGVTKYEWSTAGDERVRQEHEGYDGKTYTWAKPPPDGHPGTAIRCRCVAIGVLEG